MAGDFKQKITIQFSGAAKAEKGAKKVETSMGKLSKSVLKAGAVYFGAQGLIAGIQKSVQLATQSVALEKAFTNLGKKIGLTSSSINKFSKAVDGTVNNVDLMKSANQAMTLGVVKSEEDMAKLFDTAQRLGKSLGVDTVSAIDSLVTGMGRQSIMMLDNLGIIVDTQKAYDDYADTINKTASELTDQEKKIAFNNAALASAEDKVGNLGAESLDAGDAMAQFSVSVDELFKVLGESFLPVIGKVAGWLTKAATATRDWFSSFGESDLETAIRDLKEYGQESLVLSKLLAKENLAELKRQKKSKSSAEDLARGIESYMDKRAKGAKKLARVQEALFQRGDSMSKHEKETLKGKIRDLKQEDSDRKTRLETLQEELGLAVQIANEKENLKEIELSILEQNGEYVEKKEVENQVLRTNNDLTIKKQEIAQKEFEEVNPLLNIMNQSYNDLVVGLGKVSKETVNASMAIGASQKSASDAASASATAFITAEIQKAVASMITKAFGQLGFFGGLAASVTAGVFGKNLATTIKSIQAAEGFDGIVTEPTLILAGEEGAEYVDIEPTMNEGEGRGGASIVFTGNLLSKDFIEDEAMIKSALRKGGDIGIS